MRVAIVGAGFVGLTSAFRLLQQGLQVELFEASEIPGGLASGFQLPQWDWPLERFYHHIFSNDQSIIRLSREIGWPAQFYRPTTSLYYNQDIFPFDSAKHLLAFPHLTIGERLRMGATLGFLKITPFWKPLEHVEADNFLSLLMGSRGYETVWKPLLKAKFGPHYKKVNAAWFWARIHKRTPTLGYFQRGFQGLADQLTHEIRLLGGSIHLNSPVVSIEKKKRYFKLITQDGIHSYDRVLVTTATPLFLSMVPELPQEYRRPLLNMQHLDALVVTLVSRKSVMQDVYWLNVLDARLPFVIVVEHTNMITSQHYGNQHLLYLGAYLPTNHPFFQLSKRTIISLAFDELRSIYPTFDAGSIVDSFVHRGRYAQPVVPINYSQRIPNFRTPINYLYLGNLSMVYPWDRGTNYAVELGETLANIITQS